MISKGTEVSYSVLSTGNYKEGCFWTAMWEAKIANYYLEEFIYHVKRLGVILGLQDLKVFNRNVMVRCVLNKSIFFGPTTAIQNKTRDKKPT